MVFFYSLRSLLRRDDKAKSKTKWNFPECLYSSYFLTYYKHRMTRQKDRQIVAFPNEVNYHRLSSRRRRDLQV